MSDRVNSAKWDAYSNRWRITVKRDGISKTFVSSKPGRKGMLEANKKADTWLDSNRPSENMRVSAAYEKYKESQLGRRGTVNDKDIISKGNNWIIPYIGHKMLCKVTLGDLQDILDDAERQGKSLKTIKNIRGRLSSFFKFCRIHNWTQLRTEDLTVSEFAPTKKKTILQPDALKTLFTSSETFLRGQPAVEPWINAYRFQVVTGLLPGELIGLKWTDIFDGVIHLQRAINYYGEQTTGKNKNAIRNIVVNKTMQQILDDQKQRNPDGEFVFEITSEQTYLKRWHRYCEVNDIPKMTVYELRHTFVSITASVLTEGELKNLVGHSENMDTYGVYAHLVEGDLGRSADTIESRFEELLADNPAEKSATICATAD